MPVTIANREESEQSLIWVCAVCRGVFGRQLVLESSEHLS